jgi:HPr kinase/phosphorylase
MSPHPPRITIGELLEERGKAMNMELIAGENGLYRYIDHPRMQKPSLAFAGFLENLSDYRLQVVGLTELHYLETRPEAERKAAVNAVFDLCLAGVVVTGGETTPDIILEAAQRTDTPLVTTPLRSSAFMTDMMLFLSKRLAPSVFQHGVYLDVFGVGVLLIGASGIGKSEIALELIERGHRLISDDMVELVRQGPEVLVGHSPESLKYHMEIRGLGILNIRDLYGAAAITDTKRLRLVIEVIPWEKLSEEDRILGGDSTITLNKVTLPKIRIPIRPGRSLAVIIEVATRNQLLKQRGLDSNKAFTEALEERIRKGSAK